MYACIYEGMCIYGKDDVYATVMGLSGFYLKNKNKNIFHKLK